MYVNLLLLVVFGTVTALLTLAGLWRSLVTFLNLLAAATLAMGWSNVVSGYVKEQIKAETASGLAVDFVVVWLLFTVLMAIFRETTDRIAAARLAFPTRVDQIAGGLCAAVTAWTVTAFTAATLHMAPVSADAIVHQEGQTMLFGLGPDRGWLTWMHNASQSGPFSRSGSGGQNVFPTAGEFVSTYAEKRKSLDEEIKKEEGQPAQ